MDEERIKYGFRSGLTGRVDKPVLKGLLDRRQRANMSEEAEYAFMASKQALEQAGISDQYLLDNEVGCIFGNDSTAKAVIEGYRVMEEKHDSELAYPVHIPIDELYGQHEPLLYLPPARHQFYRQRGMRKWQSCRRPRLYDD